MENGSNYFFSLLVGWRGKEMEQSTGHNPAFRAVAWEQKLHKCKMSFCVCSVSDEGTRVCRCKSSTRKSYTVQALLLILLHCLQS